MKTDGKTQAHDSPRQVVLESCSELRRRALIVGGLFLAVHPLYTLIQVVALVTNSLPDFVVPSVFEASITVNLVLDVVGTLFVTVNAVAPRTGWTDRRVLYTSTVLTALTLLAGWIIQLHFGGSQTSHMLAVILGTLLASSWFLPVWGVVVLASAASAGVATLVGLEWSHILPYSPLVNIGPGMDHIYLHPAVLAMNAVIYLFTVGLTIWITVRLQRELREGRVKVRDKNLLLEAEVAERSRAQATLRRAVEELTAATESQRLLLQAAAHDLRSPLRAISGFASLLQRRLDDRADDKARTDLERILDGVSHMSQLVDDLSRLVLDASNEVVLAPCDSGVVLARVLGFLEAPIAAAGALVEAGEMPRVLADEARLTRVFQNLVANSIKFHGKEPPRIRIDAVQRGTRWEFSVQDNGIGFDPVHAERIFEPFERLAPRGSHEGNGIGLAVCRLAIEAMEGRIWAEGNPGEGATFRFTLQGSMPDREEIPETLLT
jgi:signal transduction histidine kinase